MLAQVDTVVVDQTEAAMLDQTVQVAPVFGVPRDAIQVESCHHASVYDNYD